MTAKTTEVELSKDTIKQLSKAIKGSKSIKESLEDSGLLGDRTGIIGKTTSLLGNTDELVKNFSNFASEGLKSKLLGRKEEDVGASRTGLFEAVLTGKLYRRNIQDDMKIFVDNVKDDVNQQFNDGASFDTLSDIEDVLNKTFVTNEKIASQFDDITTRMVNILAKDVHDVNERISIRDNFVSELQETVAVGIQEGTDQSLSTIEDAIHDVMTPQVSDASMVEPDQSDQSETLLEIGGGKTLADIQSAITESTDLSNEMFKDQKSAARENARENRRHNLRGPDGRFISAKSLEEPFKLVDSFGDIAGLLQLAFFGDLGMLALLSGIGSSLLALPVKLSKVVISAVKPLAATITKGLGATAKSALNTSKSVASKSKGLISGVEPAVSTALGAVSSFEGVVGEVIATSATEVAGAGMLAAFVGMAELVKAANKTPVISEGTLEDFKVDKQIIDKQIADLPEQNPSFDVDLLGAERQRLAILKADNESDIRFVEDGLLKRKMIRLERTKDVEAFGDISHLNDPVSTNDGPRSQAVIHMNMDGSVMLADTALNKLANIILETKKEELASQAPANSPFLNNQNVSTVTNNSSTSIIQTPSAQNNQSFARIWDGKASFRP